jgi:hypothetical protein
VKTKTASVRKIEELTSVRVIECILAVFMSDYFFD